MRKPETVPELGFSGRPNSRKVTFQNNPFGAFILPVKGGAVSTYLNVVFLEQYVIHTFAGEHIAKLYEYLPMSRLGAVFPSKKLAQSWRKFVLSLASVRKPETVPM